MAVSVSPNLTDVTLGETADSSYWTGTDGNSAEIYRQGSGSEGWVVAKNANESAYFDYYSKATALLDMSVTNTHLYCTIRCDIAPYFDYLRIGLQSDTAHGSSSSGTKWWTIVDNTSNIEWYGEWKTFVLDVNDSSLYYAAGSSGTLDLSGITDIHFQVDNSNSGNIRSIENTYIDTIRFGTGLSITGTAWDWDDVAGQDSSTTYKWDIIRKVGPGVFEISGQLEIGVDDTAQTTTTPNSSNEALFFRDPSTEGVAGGSLGAIASSFYQISAVGGGTVVDFNNMSCLAGANTPFLVDFDDSSLPSSSLDWNGGTVLGAGQGVKFKSQQTIKNVSFIQCEQVVPSTSTFENNTISSYVTDSGSEGGALLWPGGTTVKNCSFIDNDDAIEVTQTSSQTYDGLTFTSNTYDTHLNNGGTDVNISKNNGSNPTTYRATGGGTVTYVGASVTISVDTKTVAGVDVDTVRVILRAYEDSAVGTGPFPYQDSVTIVNSDPTAGPIATVTHTGHGMSTGDYIEIDGASISANNGVKQITVVDANSYTYDMVSYPGGNPTGTITCTFVALYGLSSGGTISTNRVYPSNQAVEGHARKSSATPFYKSAPLVGVVDSTSGFSATAVMILDE
jgi:hypothetical protein